jgi:hypothetical protein
VLVFGKAKIKVRKFLWRGAAWKTEMEMGNSINMAQEMGCDHERGKKNWLLNMSSAESSY